MIETGSKVQTTLCLVVAITLIMITFFSAYTYMASNMSYINQSFSPDITNVIRAKDANNYYKTLFLRNYDENYTLLLSRGKELLSVDIQSGGWINFHLPWQLRSNFTINWGIAHIYIIPHVNMYLNPTVVVQLSDTNTIVSTKTVTIGSEGWYDFVFNLHYVFTPGKSIELRIGVEDNLPGSYVTIKYSGNKTSYDSYLRFETTTPIFFRYVKTYDSQDNERTEFNFTDTIKIMSAISSPFGTADITVPYIKVQRASTGEIIINNAIMDPLYRNESTGTSIYGYTILPLGFKGGTYIIRISVSDFGTQHIWYEWNFTLPSTAIVTPKEMTKYGRPDEKVEFTHTVSTIAEQDVFNINISVTEYMPYILYIGGIVAIKDCDGDGNYTDAGDIYNTTVDWNGDGIIDTGLILKDSTVEIKLVATVPWAPSNSKLAIGITLSGTITGDGYVITDNVIVSSAARLDLTPKDLSTAGVPGDSIKLRHEITNMGNCNDTYGIHFIEMLGIETATLEYTYGTSIVYSNITVDSTVYTPTIPVDTTLTFSIIVNIPKDSDFDTYMYLTFEVYSMLNSSVKAVSTDQIKVGRIGLDYNTTTHNVYPMDTFVAQIVIINYDSRDNEYTYNLQFIGNATCTVDLYLDNGDGIYTKGDTYLGSAVGSESMGGGWIYVNPDYNKNGFPAIDGRGGENITLWPVFNIGPGIYGKFVFEFRIVTNYGDSVKATMEFYGMQKEDARLLPDGQEVFASQSSTAIIVHEIMNVGNVAIIPNVYVKCPKNLAISIYLDINSNGVLDENDELVSIDANSDGDFSDYWLGDTLNIRYDYDENDYPDFGLFEPMDSVGIIIQVVVPNEGIYKGDRIQITTYIFTTFGHILYNTTDIIIIDNAPVAMIPASVVVVAGTEILIDASESYDSDNDRLIFRWDFNDPYAIIDTYYGAIGRHVYRRPGNYTAKLTIYDGTINVTYPVNINVKIPLAKHEPLAIGYINGYYTTAVVHQDEWVYFDAHRSYDPDGGMVQCQWEIYTSWSNEKVVSLIGKSVSYMFDIPGLYYITLIVYDDEGNCTNTTLYALVLEDLGISIDPVIKGDVAEVLEPMDIGIGIKFSPPQAQVYETSVHWHISSPYGDVVEGEGMTASFIPMSAGEYIMDIRVEVNYGGVLCSVQRIYNFTVVSLKNHAPIAVIEVGYNFKDAQVMKVFDNLKGIYGCNITSTSIPLIINATKSYDPEGDVLDFNIVVKAVDNHMYQYEIDGKYNEYLFPVDARWNITLELSDGEIVAYAYTEVMVLDNIPPVLSVAIRSKNGSIIALVNSSNKEINLTDGDIKLDTAYSYDPDVTYGKMPVSMIKTLWFIDNRCYSAPTIDLELGEGKHNITVILIDDKLTSVIKFYINIPISRGIMATKNHITLDVYGVTKPYIKQDLYIWCVEATVPEYKIIYNTTYWPYNISVNINASGIETDGYKYQVSLNFLLKGTEDASSGIYNALLIFKTGLYETKVDITLYYRVHNIDITVLETYSCKDLRYGYRIANLGYVDEYIYVNTTQPFTYIVDGNGVPLSNPFVLRKNTEIDVYIYIKNMDNISIEIGYIDVMGRFHGVYNTTIDEHDTNVGGVTKSKQGSKIDDYIPAIAIVTISLFVALILRYKWRHRKVRKKKIIYHIKSKGHRQRVRGKPIKRRVRQRPKTIPRRKFENIDANRNRVLKCVIIGICMLSFIGIPLTSAAGGMNTIGDSNTTIRVYIDGVESYNLTTYMDTEHEFYMDITDLNIQNLSNLRFYWVSESEGYVIYGQSFRSTLPMGIYELKAIVTDGIVFYERTIQIKSLVRTQHNDIDIKLYDSYGNTIKNGSVIVIQEHSNITLTVTNKCHCPVILKINATVSGKDNAKVIPAPTLCVIFKNTERAISVEIFNTSVGESFNVNITVEIYYIKDDVISNEHINTSNTGVDYMYIAAYEPILNSMNKTTLRYSIGVSIPKASEKDENTQSFITAIFANMWIITHTIALALALGIIYYGLKPYIEAWDIRKTLYEARMMRLNRIKNEDEHLLPSIELSPNEIEIISPDKIEDNKKETESFNTMISLGDMDVIMPPYSQSKKWRKK